MSEILATNRRDFVRLAGAAGAGAGLLGTGIASAAMIEQASRPVWAFHPDYLYLDTSGMAEAYRPPLGARGADHLAALEAEELARMPHHI